MTNTAILYARVSTPKQVEKGYSLDQQIECLCQYAAEHELEVLEEIRDAGYSGATLDRPGMDRIFAVVAGGGVDVVLAQDADRITREPWHFGYLKAEFERYGTKLRALDDGDDETPEGEFFAGIRRGKSKMEREYTKRRTRRGKEKKIRSGKLLGSGPPPYGFRWVQDDKGKRIGFEVDPEAMPVVHRLFELVGAHGLPMYTAAKELERQGFYAPKGGLWRVSVIRNILLNDVYRPHTVEELRASGHRRRDCRRPGHGGGVRRESVRKATHHRPGSWTPDLPESAAFGMDRRARPERGRSSRMDRVCARRSARQSHTRLS